MEEVPTHNKTTFFNWGTVRHANEQRGMTPIYKKDKPIKK